MPIARSAHRIRDLPPKDPCSRTFLIRMHFPPRNGQSQKSSRHPFLLSLEVFLSVFDLWGRLTRNWGTASTRVLRPRSEHPSPPRPTSRQRRPRCARCPAAHSQSVHMQMHGGAPPCPAQPGLISPPARNPPSPFPPASSSVFSPLVPAPPSINELFQKKEAQ